MKMSVYDLAHSKGMPTAATEAMLLMQDRIEALTAENKRLRALLYPDEMTQEDYEMIYGWGGQG